MSYTKGKWKLLPARNRNYLGDELDVYERTIQRCFYLCGPKHDSHFVADLIVSTEKEGLANARLVAAAPQLLEACKAVNNVNRDDLMASLYGAGGIMAKVDAAIEAAGS